MTSSSVTRRLVATWTCGTPCAAAAASEENSRLSRTTTSGRQCSMRSDMAGSAASAKIPANPSRSMMVLRSSNDAPRIRPNIAPRSAPVLSPTAWNGRPTLRTAGSADPGAATQTSWPSSVAAAAKGTSGPRWPAPAVVANRMRIGLSLPWVGRWAPNRWVPSPRRPDRSPRSPLAASGQARMAVLKCVPTRRRRAARRWPPTPRSGSAPGSRAW